MTRERSYTHTNTARQRYIHDRGVCRYIRIIHNLHGLLFPGAGTAAGIQKLLLINVIQSFYIILFYLSLIYERISVCVVREWLILTDLPPPIRSCRQTPFTTRLSYCTPSASFIILSRRRWVYRSVGIAPPNLSQTATANV